MITQILTIITIESFLIAILSLNYLRFKRQIKNDTMVNNAKEGKKKSA